VGSSAAERTLRQRVDDGEPRRGDDQSEVGERAVAEIAAALRRGDDVGRDGHDEELQQEVQQVADQLEDVGESCTGEIPWVAGQLRERREQRAQVSSELGEQGLRLFGQGLGELLHLHTHRAHAGRAGGIEAVRALVSLHLLGQPPRAAVALARGVAITADA